MTYYNIKFINTLDNLLRKKLISKTKGKSFETGMALLSLGVMAGCGEIESLLGIDDKRSPAVNPVELPGPAQFPTLALTVEGDSGFNIHDASSSTENIHVDLRPDANGTASASDGTAKWGLVSVEGFYGGSGNDIFIGTEAKNTFDGGAGNDLFWSRGGGDDLNGGAGDDVFVIVGSNIGANAITYTADSLKFTAEELTGYGALDLADIGMTLADVNNRTTSEGTTGTKINGGAGTDTIIIYGQVDFTGINRSNISAERIVLNSVLTLDKEFLEPQTETITLNDGTQEMMEVPKIIIEGRDERSQLKIEADDTSGTMTVDLSEFKIEGELIVEGTAELGGNAGVVVSTTFVVDTETVQDLAEVKVTLGSIEMKSELGLKAGEDVDEETLGSLADILEKSKETLKDDDAVNIMFKDERIDGNDKTKEIMVKIENGELKIIIGNEEAELGNYSTNKLGTAGADIIIGMGGVDLIYGRAGDDTLSGGNGNDTINGDEGDDLIGGDNGDDLLNGGDGVDRISGGRGNDFIYGDQDDDFIDGGAGYDRIFGDNEEIVSITTGETNNDILFGGSGVDIIDGGVGNDIIGGGYGNDRIYGGAGNDTIYGGYGLDIFVVSTGNDEIHDFGALDPDVIGPLGGTLWFDASKTGVDSIDDLTFSYSGTVGNRDLHISYMHGGEAHTTTLKDNYLEHYEHQFPESYVASFLRNVASGTYSDFDAAAKAHFTPSTEASRPSSTLLAFVAEVTTDDATNVGGVRTIAGTHTNVAGIDIFTHEKSANVVEINFATKKVIVQADNSDLLYDISGIEGFHGGAGNDTITLNQNARNENSAGFRGYDINGYIGHDIVLVDEGRSGIRGNVGNISLRTPSTTSTSFDHKLQDIEEIRGVGDETNVFQLIGEFTGVLLNGAGGTDDKLAIYSVLSTRFGKENIYDLRGGSQILAYENEPNAFTHTINVKDVEIFELQQSRNETVVVGKDSTQFEIINGGAGIDTLRIDSTPDIGETELITADVNLNGDSKFTLSNGTEARISGFERIFGGRGDDTITGNDEANYLNGGEGNDKLDGGGGNDFFLLQGEDRIIGGSGTDTLRIHDDYKTGYFTVLGLNHENGDLGDVEIDRGGEEAILVDVSDVEIYDFSNVVGAVYADVRGSRITTIRGGSGDDIFFGGGGINNNGGSVFTGGSGLNRFIFTEDKGNFTVTDFDGDGVGSNVLDIFDTGVSDIDTLTFAKSGTNNDTLTISDTSFTITLQGAANTISAFELATTTAGNSLAGSQAYNTAARAYFSDGGAGDDILFLTDEVVNIAGDGDDADSTIEGTNIDDEIDGGGGDDTINGGGGNDDIDGGDGADTLIGGAGFDTLDGGIGDDTLTGSNGDRLIGGTGADTFIYDATDSSVHRPLIITDFDPTEGDTLVFAENTELSGLFHASGQSTNATVSFVKSHFFPVMYITSLDQREAFVLLEDSQAIIDAIEAGAPEGASFNSLARDYFLKEANTANPDITFENSIRGTAEDDTALSGTAGRDIIRGLEGDDTINGGTGNDIIYGGAGNDIITGGLRAVSYQLEGSFNHMYGGDGDDTFHATNGDTATGGAGADTFRHEGVYTSRDFTITDFNTAEDNLVLHNWGTAVVSGVTEYVDDSFGLRFERNGDNLTLSTLFHTVTLNDVADLINDIDTMGSGTSFNVRGQSYFSSLNNFPGKDLISFTNDSPSPAQQPSPNSFALSIGHMIELDGGIADSQEIEFNIGDRLIFNEVNGIASADSLSNADILLDNGNIIIDFGAEEVVVSGDFRDNLFGADNVVDTDTDMTAFLSTLNVEFA